MNYIILLLVFIYGIVFGSFYNVIIYRLPIDLSVARGRSFCTTCNHKLSTIDLVPVLSYITLGGKCRYCGCNISKRYPLIELITGLYFSLSYIVFGFTLQMLFITIFWSYLFIVSMIDIDHKVILDSISLFFFIIFVSLKFLITGSGLITSIIAGIIAFIIYLLIHIFSYKYYGREAFGLGDVFFIGVVGFCLGLNVLYLTIFFPFILAVICIIICFILGKKQSLNMEVPFAPFISLSAFILTLYGDQMMSFIF